MPGVAGFSDDGAPVRSAAILRNALAYAGALGLPIVDHAEDPSLTDGAEAAEGYVATVLGLRGWPVSAESGPVARAIAILAEVVARRARRAAPPHAPLDGRRARARPRREGRGPAGDVRRDAPPPRAHRRVDRGLAPLGVGVDRRGRPGHRPVARRQRERPPPFDPSLRVNPPLRSAEDAAACLAALRDGTADAIATDHAPHTEVDKRVEFGWAANGISGIETAISVVLAAVDAGVLPLARAIEALTTGPARRPRGSRRRAGARRSARASPPTSSSSTGRPAGPWMRRPSARGAPTRRCSGATLPGVVRLTVAGGRIAFEAPGPELKARARAARQRRSPARRLGSCPPAGPPLPRDRSRARPG